MSPAVNYRIHSVRLTDGARNARFGRFSSPRGGFFIQADLITLRFVLSKDGNASWITDSISGSNGYR